MSEGTATPPSEDIVEPEGTATPPIEDIVEPRRRSNQKRRKKAPPNPHHRLDIQGLRMVAVVLVFLDHLFGWPHGGFIGVDVFFVISGFLITGILFRDAEKLGHVSFVEFYRRRVRRIVPAATLTLAAIVVAAFTMFSPPRFQGTWWDSVAAFFFFSNWRFAIAGSDYFTATGPISPVRHFWSLSVEEQFYFVWPAVMAIIVFFAVRKTMSSSRRQAIAGSLMAALVVGSFVWAVINTAAQPGWAYYSTFTRVWELGFGALIAIFATSLGKMPHSIRPVLAWVGIVLIAFGAFWITENIGFPGPWAAIPVVGSGLVIIAGIDHPARFLWPLTNPVSVKIGDLSYSLYLWHWPVIVFLGIYMHPEGWQYYVAALCITAALSTLAYYFVEQPLLASAWLKPRSQQPWRHRQRSRDRRRDLRRNWESRVTFTMTQSRQIAGLTAVAVLAIGLGVLSMAPKEVPAYISAASVDAPTADGAENPALTPALADLQEQLKAAVKTPDWPAMNPTMEDVINGDKVAKAIARCGRGLSMSKEIDCWFGADTAPHTIALTGDSIGMSYLEPLIGFVNASGGQWKLINLSAFNCPLIGADVHVVEDEIAANCPAHKQHVVDTINQVHPDVVIVSNHYGKMVNAQTQQQMTAPEQQDSTQAIIQQFQPSVGKVALLTAPPAEKSPTDCYRPDGSPADCVGSMTSQYKARLAIDTAIAQAIGGELIDTHLLFCTSTGYCPMFVGTTPMKFDDSHISPAYGDLMVPAFSEILRASPAFATAP